MSKLSTFISNPYAWFIKSSRPIHSRCIVTTAQIQRAINAADELGLDPSRIAGFDRNIANICNTLDHERDVTRFVHSNLAILPGSAYHFSDAAVKRKQKIFILAAEYHDCGKLNQDQDILYKKDRLTDADLRHIQNHAYLSYELLRRKPVAFYNRALQRINRENGWDYQPLSNTDNAAVIEIATAALHHHELMDGTGYPYKLVGHQIPEASRLIAVADNYDAQTKERCYKKARPSGEVLREIFDRTSVHFDPIMVAAHIINNASKSYVQALLTPDHIVTDMQVSRPHPSSIQMLRYAYAL